MTMHVYSSPKEIQDKLHSIHLEKKSIGFVPTMGYLHEGHLELVRQARKENDIVAVSIFVNKKQFGENEDFTTYPSDIDSDLKKLKDENVDFLFLPSHDQIYPDVFFTSMNISNLSEHLCGLSRPGHFDGVILIVSKLLNIISPDRIYFGQKDYQQCLIIRQMMKDLNFRSEMIICPIVRERDGLAMSSRNSYLNEDQRSRAPRIQRTLLELKSMIESGVSQTEKLKKYFKQQMDEIDGKIDYIEFTDLNSLQSQIQIKRPLLIAAAVFIGKTRLIDNIIIE